MEMTPFKAVSIIERIFEWENATEEEEIEAWQYLIDTGIVWTLQGWYGRTAKELIKSGICHPKSDNIKQNSEV